MNMATTGVDCMLYRRTSAPFDSDPETHPDGWEQLSQPLPPMHSTRRALLDAVIANPGDDLPRLVFADWCEDNGESERAEFIRWQLASPGHTSEGPLRTNGLLSVGDKSWLWSKASGCTMDVPEINRVHRRGFIAELRGPLATLLEHGPAIAAEHPLESVSVTDRDPAYFASAYFAWFDEDVPVGTREWERSRLPESIMQRIEGGVWRSGGNNCISYLSASDAKDRLFAAVLAEIKKPR
jgi:uncharacterized protein (TIGR02996 family)